MFIKQNASDRLPSIRCRPFQKSSSMVTLIYGDPAQTNKKYVDSLERYEKDFATIDRQKRQRKVEGKKQSYGRRRSQAFERQSQIKQYQNKPLNKLTERQHKSQALYQQGQIKSVHNHSIPINPINANYEGNEKGQKLQHIDEDRNVNRLVRAHKLQMYGNTGYNIINGRQSINIEKLVPEKDQNIFENRLYSFYAKYQINPQAN